MAGYLRKQAATRGRNPRDSSSPGGPRSCARPVSGGRGLVVGAEDVALAGAGVAEAREGPAARRAQIGERLAASLPEQAVDELAQRVDRLVVRHELAGVEAVAAQAHDPQRLARRSAPACDEVDDQDGLGPEALDRPDRDRVELPPADDPLRSVLEADAQAARLDRERHAERHLEPAEARA